MPNPHLPDNSFFTAERVRAFWREHGRVRWLFTPRGVSYDDPEHLANRLANSIASCEENECWLWDRKSKVGGYGSLSIARKTTRAHRLAFELSNGPIPKDKMVLHSCANRACINPEHLRLGTASDNLVDRFSPGGLHRPRRSWAKLTCDEVRQIRCLVDNGFSLDSVAALFPVSKQTVSAIKNRKTWRHVSP